MPFKESKWMTSGGSVDENLPVNAGDTCSIPGLGRAHVPRGSQASGPRALEAVHLELGATVRSPWTMVKNSPYLPQSEKASTQPQRPGAAKNKYINDFLKNKICLNPDIILKYFMYMNIHQFNSQA